MTPLEKAERAKQVLNDPVFAHVFNDLRESLVLKLEACPVSNVEAQHDLTITLQLLKLLKTQLTRYTDEIVVDNARQKHESWIAKARQRIMP